MAEQRHKKGLHFPHFLIEERIARGASFPPCPSCAGHRVEKLLSAPAVIFKGGGFHKTDYRSAPKKETLAPAKPATEKTVVAKPQAAPAQKAEVTPKN